MENSSKYHGMRYVITMMGIFYHTKLTWAEKYLFSIIYQLAQDPERGCWASNNYLGKMFSMTPQSISRAIAKLRDLGLIIIKYFDVRQDGVFIRQERRIFVPDSILTTIKEYESSFYNDFVKSHEITINESKTNNLQNHDLASNGSFSTILPPLTKPLTDFNETGEGVRSKMLNNNKSSNIKSKRISSKEEISAEAQAVASLSNPLGQEATTFKRIKPNILKEADISYQKATAPVESRTVASKKGKASIDQPVPAEQIKTLPEKQEDSPVNNGTLRSVAMEIISYWINSGFLLNEKYKEKTLIKLEDLMKRKFFKNIIGYEKYQDKKFKKQDIIAAIDNFKKAAFDNNYNPPDLARKKKYSKERLDIWIYNQFNTSKTKSLFICFFEKPPKLRVSQPKQLPDQFPELTDFIKTEFTMQTVNMPRPVVPWNSFDEQKFIESSAQMMRFIESQNGNVPDYLKQMLQKPEFAAKLLVKSVVAWMNPDDDPSRLTPGYLRTPLTFNSRLPSYIKQHYPMARNDYPTISSWRQNAQG